MLQSLKSFAHLISAQGFKGKSVTYVVPEDTLFQASIALDHFACLYQCMKPNSRSNVVPAAWMFSRKLLEGYLEHAPRPIEQRQFNHRAANP